MHALREELDLGGETVAIPIASLTDLLADWRSFVDEERDRQLPRGRPRAGGSDPRDADEARETRHRYAAGSRSSIVAPAPDVAHRPGPRAVDERRREPGRDDDDATVAQRPRERDDVRAAVDGLVVPAAEQLSEARARVRSHWL